MVWERLAEMLEVVPRDGMRKISRLFRAGRERDGHLVHGTIIFLAGLNGTGNGREYSCELVGERRRKLLAT